MERDGGEASGISERTEFHVGIVPNSCLPGNRNSRHSARQLPVDADLSAQLWRRDIPEDWEGGESLYCGEGVDIMNRGWKILVLTSQAGASIEQESCS